MCFLYTRAWKTDSGKTKQNPREVSEEICRAFVGILLRLVVLPGQPHSYLKLTGRERLDTHELSLLLKDVAARIALIQPPIADLKQHLRNRERTCRNKLCGIVDCDYKIRDMVLFPTAETESRSKLQLTWIGPCVVVSISSPFT